MCAVIFPCKLDCSRTPQPGQSTEPGECRSNATFNFSIPSVHEQRQPLKHTCNIVLASEITYVDSMRFNRELPPTNHEIDQW